ncbi:MAG: ABC transporter permease [Christensenellales bacterium]|jgi:putative aldouronate transport system permease protein
MSVINEGRQMPSYPRPAKSRYAVLRKGILRHWQLYLLVLLPLVYVVLFSYVPMYGIVIAFKDYKISQSIMESPWVGMKHFKSFFTSYQLTRLLGNTIGLSLYSIIVGIFPPIILAVSLNYCSNKFVGKTVQMITYMPYFISTVLVVGMINQILSLNGPVNTVLKMMGKKALLFLGEPKYFKTIYVFSGIWASNGYNAVIYLAALSSINPELYEAAIVDGASVVRRIWHIDIPSIMPTAIILLIMACGRLLSVGHEKVLLLQNDLNISTSDVISTYVYRIGLVSMQYSFSTAVGLFQSFVSLIMLTFVNSLARRFSETSLF